MGPTDFFIYASATASSGNDTAGFVFADGMGVMQVA
jgi:hypothetical protein